jgi:hypothetical protein
MSILKIDNFKGNFKKESMAAFSLCSSVFISDRQSPWAGFCPTARRAS